MITIILLAFAFVLAVLAARNVGADRGWSLGWASLACYFLSLLVSTNWKHLQL